MDSTWWRRPAAWYATCSGRRVLLVLQAMDCGGKDGTIKRVVATPWYVVPADRKWYRDWAVAHVLRETFDTLALGYPAADFDVKRERERLLGTARPVKVNGS